MGYNKKKQKEKTIRTIRTNVITMQKQLKLEPFQIE
jgi:hypothetical protein